MDWTLHLHPAAAAAAVIAGIAIEAACRASLARRPPAGNAPRPAIAWGLGFSAAAVSALVMAEVLARLGIGSLTGGAVGGLALGAGLYAAPRLAEGGWRAPHDPALIAWHLAQFGVMGAVIGGLSYMVSSRDS